MKKVSLLLWSLSVLCLGQNSAVLVTGPITAAGATCAPSSAPNPNCVVLSLNPSIGQVAITIPSSPTFSATLQFEWSTDGGATWSSLAATPNGGGTAVTSATAAGVWVASVGGGSFVRVRGSAYTSGTAQVTLNPSQAPTATLGGSSSSGGTGVPNSSATQGYGNSGNAAGTALTPSPFVGFDTTQVSGSDRCAAIKSAWGSQAGKTAVNAQGESANASSSQISCLSNPFPVSSNYGGTDAETGGVFLMPEGAILAAFGLQVGNNAVSVKGVGPGTLPGATFFGSNLVANPTGWSNGTTGCAGAGAICLTYNPFALAIGAAAGYTSTVSAGVGPYQTTVSDVAIDCRSIAGVGGVSMTAQENSGVRHSAIRNCRGASVLLNTVSTDSEALNGLYVTHPLQASVEVNTTLASGIQWFSDTHGNVLVNWSNAQTATPACGMTAVLTGATAGAGGVNPSGVHQISALVDASNNLLLCDKTPAALASTNMNSTVKQIVFEINSTTADSQTTNTGATLGFYSTGLDVNALLGRKLSDVSLTSNLTAYGAGAFPYCEAAVSGGGIELDGFHVEEGQVGFCIGLEQQALAVIITNSTPYVNVHDGIHLYSNFGAAPNFQALNVVTGSGVTNTLVDDFNGNTYTHANNPILSYWTDGGGTSYAVASLCSETTKGWCSSGKGWAYYSGGVIVQGFNLSNQLFVNGIAVPVTLSGENPQSGTYQVLASDFSGYKTILVASGTFTITLVANTSQPPAGQYVKVLNYGTGVVTIARSGQNINGGTASVTVQAIPTGSPQAADIAYVESDGTNYFTSVSGPNASFLSGKTFASPGTIGSSTPNTGAFTTLSASGTLTGSNTVRLTADSSGITATTPGTTFLTLPTLAASTNYSFDCEVLYSQATAAVLDGLSVQAATNAATRWDAWGTMYTADPITGTVTGSQSSALNVTTTTATPVVTATPAATATVYQARLSGTVQVGASVPTVNVLAFTGNASDAVTIKAGSFCSVNP